MLSQIVRPIPRHIPIWNHFDTMATLDQRYHAYATARIIVSYAYFYNLWVFIGFYSSPELQSHLLWDWNNQMLSKIVRPIPRRNAIDQNKTAHVINWRLLAMMHQTDVDGNYSTICILLRLMSFYWVLQ